MHPVQLSAAPKSRPEQKASQSEGAGGAKTSFSAFAEQVKGVGQQALPKPESAAAPKPFPAVTKSVAASVFIGPPNGQSSAPAKMPQPVQRKVEVVAKGPQTAPGSKPLFQASEKR